MIMIELGSIRIPRLSLIILPVASIRSSLERFLRLWCGRIEFSKENSYSSLQCSSSLLELSARGGTGPRRVRRTGCRYSRNLGVSFVPVRRIEVLNSITRELNGLWNDGPYHAAFVRWETGRSIPLGTRLRATAPTREEGG